MWENPAHNIPKLSRKGYQPHICSNQQTRLVEVRIHHVGLVWGTYCLDPTTCGTPVGVFAVLRCAFGTKCIGHIARPAFIAIWYIFLEFTQKSLKRERNIQKFGYFVGAEPPPKKPDWCVCAWAFPCLSGFVGGAWGWQSLEVQKITRSIRKDLSLEPFGSGTIQSNRVSHTSESCSFGFGLSLFAAKLPGCWCRCFSFCFVLCFSPVMS